MEVQPVYTVKKNTRKSIYFKIMKLIYQTLLYLCGLDFGFFEYKSKKQRIFWKSVTIIQCTIISCFCGFTLDDNFIFIYIMIAHFFLSTVALVRIDPSATICKFHSYLEVIDSKIKVDNAYYSNLEKHMLFSYILDTSYRILVCVLYCLVDGKCLQPTWSAFVFFGEMMSLNIILISYTFVFYALNDRLKKLASNLDADSSDLTSMQHVYKLIVECADKYISVFSSSFCLTLIFSVPMVMLSIYGTVEYIIDNKLTITSALDYKSNYFSELETLALLIAPTIFAGLLSSQAYRIRIILHHKLMQERDETKQLEIKRFTAYVAAHPCHFRIYKVIPLDASLLTLVVNFCVTYLIVIIQFRIF